MLVDVSHIAKTMASVSHRINESFNTCKHSKLSSKSTGYLVERVPSIVNRTTYKKRNPEETKLDMCFSPSERKPALSGFEFSA